MPNYLYNGIELPALPEWDKVANPYVMICHLIAYDEWRFLVGSVRPFYSTGRLQGGDYGESIFTIASSAYQLTDGVWELVFTNESRVASVFPIDTVPVIYTNADILDDNGAIYMSAGTTTDPNMPPKPADPVLPIPRGYTHCSYNGKKLPVLTEWNIRVYPYVFIDYNNEAIASRFPLKYGEQATGDMHINNFCDNDDSWGAWGNPGHSGTVNGTQIWANYDVYDSDGVLQLKASDPVPIGDPVKPDEPDEPDTPVPDKPEPVLSWQKHDAYKLNSKSIAYLYNGVELPDINTVWTDKATYPCAIIARGIPNDTYYLTVCGDKPYYTEQSYGTEGYEPIVVAPKPFKGFSCVGGSWVLNIEDTGYGAALRTGTFELIWTNVDVMNKDNGSVYFNGSDPVIQGWDGNTFYRVMGGKWVKQDDVLPSVELRPTNCLTFSSTEPFTIATYNANKNWDGALYYSTDASAWSEWDGATSIASAEHDGKQHLYMRGIGNTYITYLVNETATNQRWVLTGNNIYCDGNIENLLDYKTVLMGEHPKMDVYCFAYMFYGCTSLVTPPDLLAANLTQNCYWRMFALCSNLTTAPKILATALAQDCCYDMFSGCINLETLPALYATDLADKCYYGMFYGCSKIKLSGTKTDSYTAEYRIPARGTGLVGTESMVAMFNNTGGSFAGKPTINTTYYTSNTVV